MNLYVVGKVENKEEWKLWTLEGIYDTEEAAVTHCNNRPLWFVGPIELNKALPEVTDSWKGSYYPNPSPPEE